MTDLNERTDQRRSAIAQLRSALEDLEAVLALLGHLLPEHQPAAVAALLARVTAAYGVLAGELETLTGAKKAAKR